MEKVSKGYGTSAAKAAVKAALIAGLRPVPPKNEESHRMTKSWVRFSLSL
jgi:hypothetical protein